MIVYNLDTEPNYTFLVEPEGYVYRFYIRYFRHLMYVTIEDAEGNRISGPIKGTNEQWLIPFPAYNYKGAGNFMLIDIEGEYPAYWRCKNKCKLVYYTSEEIENNG